MRNVESSMRFVVLVCGRITITVKMLAVKITGHHCLTISAYRQTALGICGDTGRHHDCRRNNVFIYHSLCSFIRGSGNSLKNPDAKLSRMTKADNPK